MTRHHFLLFVLIACFAFVLTGCQSPSPPMQAIASQPTMRQATNPPGQTVTVVIALSSIVPGGIVGHAGLAVQDQYWDYGPTRSKLLQPIKSIRSEAGPWWDDPEQQWAVDRSLEAVLADMPGKVHPMGSLIAVYEVQVTDAQAQAIARFWQDTYDRMRDGKDTYRLTARQCSSMVAWSLRVGLDGETSDRLPLDLHRMTPTGLYVSLNESLTHTAGPERGEPAHCTLWQLDQEGLSPWHRPGAYARLPLPQMPRLRLAYERLKHLPIDLMH